MSNTTSVRSSKSKKPKSSRRQANCPSIVRPRVKIWLEIDGEHGFCAGMYRILEAVEQVGSIKKAAEIVGLSYRNVWARLKQVEQALGHPLVDAHVGGYGKRRTTLSDTGRLMMSTYRELKKQITAASDASANTLKIELDRIRQAGANRGK